MYAFFCLILSFFLLSAAPPVRAKYDPTTVPNNKFGIHIVDVNDISDAASLVNSSGGDWGYVTVVIQEDNRDFDKWQGVFNQMRRLHLIPIVRLATHVVGTSWVIPSKESADDWARFLNSLNWPTENRYVVLFNEPNHANEWGGTLNPEGFADTVKLFTDALHKTSEDFFVMPGALDVSAASDGQAEDAVSYWKAMVAHTKDVFSDIDGWSTHSYPNPGFSGSPYATGRGTLYSYLWEKSVLKSLDVTKNLPVFITETGWIHRSGVSDNPSLLSADQVGEDLKIAAQTAWQDPSIVAVTPFVLNYQGYPFDHFSWRRLGSNDFYPQYGAYQSIAKIHGTPRQREHFTLAPAIIPHSLVAGSTYTMYATLTNSGQSILSEQDNYSLRLETNGKFTMVYDPLPVLEPGQSGSVAIHLETPSTASSYTYSLDLLHGDRSTVIDSGVVQVVPPPSVTVSVALGWRTANDAADATVLVYDDKKLLHKVNGVHLVGGKATVSGLHNIVPGKSYRIVVLVPYYLPRQRITKLSAANTLVDLPRMYPLDFNRDGKFDAADILAGAQMKPNFIASLFVGP